MDSRWADTTDEEEGIEDDAPEQNNMEPQEVSQSIGLLCLAWVSLSLSI